MNTYGLLGDVTGTPHPDQIQLTTLWIFESDFSALPRLFTMLLSATLCLLVAATSAAPMNIITILTDDQGFGDSSYNCENSTGLCARTPNLDGE